MEFPSRLYSTLLYVALRRSTLPYIIDFPHRTVLYVTLLGYT